MKKVVFFAVFAFCVGMMADAYAVSKTNTGCGLGYVVFKTKSGLISEICAITTNGTSCNQTFGITSGTLDCGQQSATLSSNERVNRFLADNLDNVASDISRGNGEYLNTLGMLMGVNEAQKSQFNTKLQRSFNRIFTSENVTHTEVLQNINNVLNAG